VHCHRLAHSQVSTDIQRVKRWGLIKLGCRIFWNTSSLQSNYSLTEATLVDLEPSEGSNVTSGNRSLSTVYLVSQVLRIDQAHMDDNQFIYCQAENDVGKANVSIEINVHCKWAEFQVKRPLTCTSLS